MASANTGAITKPQALALITALSAAQQREAQMRQLIAKLRYLVGELEATASPS